LQICVINNGLDGQNISLKKIFQDISDAWEKWKEDPPAIDWSETFNPPGWLENILSGQAKKISPRFEAALQRMWDVPTEGLSRNLDNLSQSIQNLTKKLGKFPISKERMKGERANLLTDLIPSLAGMIEADKTTNIKADFKFTANVTKEEKRSIEQLNKIIQDAWERYQRSQGNK